MPEGSATWPPRRVAVTILCAVAYLQLALGLSGLVAAALGAEWQRPTAVLDWQRALQILAFGGLATHLLLGSRRDARIEHLAGLLLLIGVFFAHPPISALGGVASGAWAGAIHAVQALTIDAFTPVMAWVFVRDFPRALEGARSTAFVRAVIGLSLAGSCWLVVANLGLWTFGESALFTPFDRTNTDGQYWALVFAPFLPILPFVVWRTRHAPLDERRRVGLLAIGIALAGVLPIAVAILPPLWPAFRVFIHTEWAENVLIPLNLLMIFAVAATTAYSVVVDRVLELRTVLRKAAQYWLANGVVAALAGIPFVLVAVLLYDLRSEPLASLLTGSTPLRLVGLLGLAAAVWVLRRRVMLAVDRLFFREAYDPQRVLADLTAEMRRSASLVDLGGSVRRRLDEALHPESSHLLVVSRGAPGIGVIAGSARRLPDSSELPSRVTAPASACIDIDLRKSGGFAGGLPESDRVWLADAGAAMLVSLTGSGGALSGMLVLGAKRSELPYSREDRLLLETLATALGDALENRLLRDSARETVQEGPTPQGAPECAECGLIASPEVDRCPECAGSLQRAPLPAELFGKFRLERRIGRGGMGVVYAAMDAGLDRRVALKTLPTASPEDSLRLRREARAMAAITHPHLALILGIESWQGTPILVLEYLAAGTLEQRIEAGPIPVHEVLEIALAMARVLERVHAAGILHRDVKPSNIGTTAEGQPKLLDFGLVRIAAGIASAERVDLMAATTETGFVGTPLYMSPEALASTRPEPGFDLWGLGVVIFESITGEHPFLRASGSLTQAAIQAGWTPAQADRIAGNEPVIELLARVLAAGRRDRPATASEMAEQIEKAMALTR